MYKFRYMYSTYVSNIIKLHKYLFEVNNVKFNEKIGPMSGKYCGLNVIYRNSIISLYENYGESIVLLWIYI